MRYPRFSGLWSEYFKITLACKGVTIRYIEVNVPTIQQNYRIINKIINTPLMDTQLEDKYQNRQQGGRSEVRVTTETLYFSVIQNFSYCLMFVVPYILVTYV
jgi:hypothetical protein